MRSQAVDGPTSMLFRFVSGCCVERSIDFSSRLRTSTVKSLSQPLAIAKAHGGQAGRHLCCSGCRGENLSAM